MNKENFLNVTTWFHDEETRVTLYTIVGGTRIIMFTRSKSFVKRNQNCQAFMGHKYI